MNAAASLIQRIVRATHNWPLAGPLYRTIYASAARAVGDLAAQEPQLSGVYARHSYALGTWEPGRSDIDITAVWKEPRPEMAGRFHQRYEKLQRRFPMLGEVEMIDERHLEAATRFGVSGLESRQWMKLGGGHTFTCRYAGNERMDRIRHAVSIYCHQFMPRFWEQPRQPQVLRRLAAKIARQLNEPSSAETDPAALLDFCLRQMGGAVRRLPAADGSHIVNYPVLLGGIRPPHIAPGAGSAAPGNGVLSVLSHSAGGSAKHVVMKSSFDARSLDVRYRGAMVTNEEVFRFYLSFVDPLEHFTLLLGRSVQEGVDPLGEFLPVPEAALRETVCHYATDLLTFPYRPGLETLTDKQFQDLLFGWFLRTLKYFEDGTFTFDYGELRAHFGARFDERAPRFALLHSIAAAVSVHMSR